MMDGIKLIRGMLLNIFLPIASFLICSFFIGCLV